MATEAARAETMSDDIGLMPQNKTVRIIVVSGVLAAIQITLSLTGLGFIPTPTGVNATILHIPAILAGVIAGGTAGVATGGIFGIFSFLRATTPLFQNPLVAIGPRLLIGLVAFLVYRAVKPVNEVLALALAGALGTLTNTAGVLGLAVLLPSPAGTPYMTPELAWSIVLTNALPEVIVATILTVAVGLAIRGAGRARRSSV